MATPNIGFIPATPLAQARQPVATRAVLGSAVSTGITSADYGSAQTLLVNGRGGMLSPRTATVNGYAAQARPVAVPVQVGGQGYGGGYGGGGGGGGGGAWGFLSSIGKSIIRSGVTVSTGPNGTSVSIGGGYGYGYGYGNGAGYYRSPYAGQAFGQDIIVTSQQVNAYGQPVITGSYILPAGTPLPYGFEVFAMEAGFFDQLDRKNVMIAANGAVYFSYFRNMH